MKVSYKYKKEKRSNSDTVKSKVINLKDYDCQFVDISVKTKENDRTIETSIMFAVQSDADIDKLLITQLQALKPKIKSLIGPYKTCQRCSAVDASVSVQLDPYQQEINQQEVQITVCDYCYDQACKDI